MSKRALFLFILALVGAGYAIHKNWPEIRVFLRFDTSGEDQAIKLVRKAYTVARGQTNNDVVLSRTSGNDIERVGWRAEKMTETRYVVRFEYQEDGEQCGIYFLVDIDTEQVSSINSEEKRERYGLPAPR